MQADWWNGQVEAVLSSVGSTPSGLSEDEAAARLARYGPNELRRGERLSALRLAWAQLANPLSLILLFAAGASAAAGEWTDTVVVVSIVAVSAAVGFWREFRAGRDVERLRARITLKTKVKRGGRELVVPSTSVVPGDVLVLSAGALVAGDALLLEARDFFVSEAELTGETFPVEKEPGFLPEARTIPERRNAVFLGTHVRSGTARAVVLTTGRATEFGRVAERLALRAPETEFDRGLRHFGGLLTRVMLVMMLAVLALNLLAHRPGVESLLFALALAVGLTPELLPAILAVNLARSASDMVREGVLVRRLNAIENFGSMTVLCTDKTGTLTEGVVRLDAAVDEAGGPSRRLLGLARDNAALQTGVSNPLDEAVVGAARGVEGLPPLPRKLDAVPSDSVRKRLSVVVEDGPGAARLVTKGAVETVLQACRGVDDARQKAVDAFVEAQSQAGFRVLAVASRAVAPRPVEAPWTKADERDLELEGFLLFADPPKPGVAETLASLRRLGVSLKVITGDNPHVTRHLCERIGLPAPRVVTGRELAEFGDDALWNLAPRTDVFAGVDPNQKERIILALKKTGAVVGYMGDGVNDAPALHAADVSISVESAVDVAREAADFVLLQRDLGVLRRGILAGRRTFANTLKYVLTTTSANLGNMLSMAAASVVLPFFPLLPGQILLNNFLSDVPAVGLANDAVDEEWLSAPRRWGMRVVRSFMFRFGALSSVFDGLMFATLLLGFGASPQVFRTAWFVESLL
ncbi:MAG: magnesium-translocating P-type ATPase, partial [Myxococcaceae bacterium]|nr:magnesium-translocating P-type ATPase [Myxococcaceae bacterium]